MNKWFYLAVISIASFLTPFLGSSMNIVIPIVGLEFNVNPIVLSWFSLSTLLSSAAIFLPLGVYGDKIGRVKIFRNGLLIFFLSTLLTSLAYDEYSFLAFRFIQGIGAAAISVSGVALISEIFPRDIRGLALGINISSVYVGLTLGPFVGGFIVSFVGWRYLFILIALMALISLYLSHRYINLIEEIHVGEFDYLGSIMLGGAYITLITGLSLYPNILSDILILIFILTIIIFVYWEYRCNYPLIDFRYLIQNRLLSLSTLTALTTYIATFGTSFLLSIYLQYIANVGAFLAGLILTIRPALMAILSTFTGRLSDFIQPKYIVSTGLLIDFLSYVILSAISIDTDIIFLLSGLILLGIGSALFSSPNTNAIMSSVDKKLYGMASGLVGTARVYGQSFSIGIISLLFSMYIGDIRIQEIPPSLLVIVMDKIFMIFGLIALITIIPSILRGDIKN